LIPVLFFEVFKTIRRVPRNRRRSGHPE
jgi:hypothetical protein